MTSEKIPIRKTLYFCVCDGCLHQGEQVISEERCSRVNKSKSLGLIDVCHNLSAHMHTRVNKYKQCEGSRTETLPCNLSLISTFSQTAFPKIENQQAFPLKQICHCKENKLKKEKDLCLTWNSCTGCSGLTRIRISYRPSFLWRSSS